MNDEWKSAWQPLIDAIGTDFSPGIRQPGADPIEHGTLRRYVEPLEFDCPLHLDDDVARAHGHPGVISPLTALTTFALPALWEAGVDPIFISEDPDAQPDVPSLRGVDTGLAPPTSGFFATDMEIEAIRPVAVGEHVSRSGWRLLDVAPKETSVGRGAFTTWESDIATESGEVVARQRLTTFSYNPHAATVEPEPVSR